MFRKIVTDKDEIKSFFGHGHFDVLMPGCVLKKDEEDYDIVIGDYFAKINDLGENLDSNGSEAMLQNIADDGTVLVVFYVYDREYEKGSWKEKKFITKGKLIFDDQYSDGDWPFYSVEFFEESTDDNED